MTQITEACEAETEKKNGESVDECAQTGEVLGGQPSPILLGVSMDALRDRICLVCAEHGMGKTAMLMRATSARSETGAAVRYEDFGGMLVSEALDKLEELYSWCQSASLSQGVPLLAIDNVPPADESDIERMSALVRAIERAGCDVMATMLPEAESFCNSLPEARRFWSCDLALPCPIAGPERDLYDQYTHGIPALHEALCKLADRPTHNIMAEPSYLEPYIDHVSSLLRAGIIEEELELRAAMLLLGSGSLRDLVAVLGNVDEGLWRQLARDVPFFSINVSTRLFRCVGAQSADGLSATHHVLAQAVSAWPELVSSVAWLLAERGELARAAVVSLLCSNRLECTAIGLAWGPDFINAGEGAIVVDALAEARGQGSLGLSGFYESECVLMALSADRWGSVSSARAELHLNTRQGRQADLALWCRELLRGSSAGPWHGPRDDADELTSALALHGEAVSLMLGGQMEQTYSLLVNSAYRHRLDRVTSVLIDMDYLFCSLLMGIGPSRGDMETWERGGTFLERIGLSSLLALHDAMPSAGGLLGGRAKTNEVFEVHVQRADRSGDTVLRGFFLLASAVSDLRGGVFTRGLVRLRHALTAFDKVGADVLGCEARLLEMAIRSQMGERIRKPEINACRGVSPALDKVVDIAAATHAHQRSAVEARTDPRVSLGCPKDVHWLVNILAHDCGSFSARFRDVMPTAWHDSVIRGAAEVDAALDCPELVEGAEANLPVDIIEEQPYLRRKHAHTKVEMCLLGGFEIRVGGMQVSGSRLERRRAKSLMTLLAAVPGHVAKRYVIIDSIWPSYDYDTANKCVYSATSVLRAELQSVMGDDGAQLVLANKAERTIALNMDYISCDVDQFEIFAHRLLDAEGQDRAVVTLCREVEDLYRGDLFVPPTDGAGIVETRCRELRDLYADAMVAGSAAATRLGLKTLACRFARKAHEADTLREDAMRVLAVALCAVGRHVEAEQCYESYVAHVVDVTRRPPSRKLRELVSELMEGVSHAERGASGVGVQGLAPSGITEVVREEDEPDEGPRQLRLDV